ncbi:HIT domain-containing protein [Candidatus Woesearchaeota archaeon]|nr:HIT domain-containing protein [Candidatus Woesearchaeota archaeon]
MPEQMNEEQLKALQEKIKQMSPEELKEFQKKQCIFCQIIAGKVQSKKIFEDNIAIGILDINPANPGHILLLPKEHYTIMPQLPEDVLSHLFMAAKALSNSMLRSLEVQGTNIIVANGVAAGQRAQHFMIHVIPRKENDGISFELPQKSIQMDELEKIGKKLVENLGSKVEDKEMPKPFVMPKKIVEAQFKEKPKEKEAKKAPIKKEKKSIEKIPKSSKENIDLDDIAKMLGVK